MKLKSRSTVFLLAIVLVAGALAGTAASQAVFAPAKIGFVDVAKVFKGYRRVKEIEAKLAEELQAIDKALMQRFNDLKKRSGELEILLEGTEEYRALQRELEFERYKLEYDQKSLKEAVGRRLVEGMTRVYTEIRNEAENFARRSGLNGVFMVNEVQMQPRNQQELQMLIASHPVLFWDKPLDLTDEILKIMNSDLADSPEEPADEPKPPADEPKEKDD